MKRVGGGLAKLRDDNMPWLVGIHCLNHRLELAVKAAFKGTSFDDICKLQASFSSSMGYLF